MIYAKEFVEDMNMLVDKAPVGGSHNFDNFGSVFESTRLVYLYECDVYSYFTGDVTIDLYEKGTLDNFSDGTLVETIVRSVVSGSTQTIALGFFMKPNTKYFLMRRSGAMMRTTTGEANPQYFNDGEFIHYEGRGLSGTSVPEGWYYFFNIKYRHVNDRIKFTKTGEIYATEFIE